MKISIVTVCLNAHGTIESCLASVSNQRDVDVEHIVIDGGSTDGTLNLINKYKDSISFFISEPDNGLYDAMNKGIRQSTGDIVGILNADDMYVNEYCLKSVIDEFDRTMCDSVFGDLVYVRPDHLDRIIRYYNSNGFSVKKFSYGWMPPHPAFFVRRLCYEMYGMYKTDYRIASDYELLVRYLAKHHVSYSYIQKVLVKMRTGGLSTRNLRSNYILNREIVRACRENGIKTNILKVLSKYFTKSFQLIQRPE